MTYVATWTHTQGEALGLIFLVATVGFVGIVKLIEWKGRR